MYQVEISERSRACQSGRVRHTIMSIYLPSRPTQIASNFGRLTNEHSWDLTTITKFLRLKNVRKRTPKIRVKLASILNNFSLKFFVANSNSVKTIGFRVNLQMWCLWSAESLMMIEQVQDQLSVTKGKKKCLPTTQLIWPNWNLFFWKIDGWWEIVHGNPSLIANFHQNLGRHFRWSFSQTH